MSEEIKEILNKLEIVARKHIIEVCEDGSKIETMSASIVDELRLNNYSAKLLLNYIQQKENIIKEAREYGENCINNLLSNEQVENPYKFSSYLALEIHKNYLEILDKGEENNGTKVL